MTIQKHRLDRILVERGYVQSRQRARALIMAGKVFVDDRMTDKPGINVPVEADITVKAADIPYVSRGGLKIEKALDTFGIDVKDKVCLDVGASTGGFTDCLLQHGAQKVFAVDVGYGQLAWKLRTDPRVVVIERTNIRYLPADALPSPVDLVAVDVSFISLKIVIPAVLKFARPQAEILALIKPQFEVGKGQVGKGGVVRDPSAQDAVIKELSIFFEHIGLECKALVDSPILGPKGNREFIILLEYSMI